MRAPATLFLSLLCTGYCIANDEPAATPVDIAVYDFAGNASLAVASLTGGNEKLITYNGALSEWHTVVPPIRLSPAGQADESANWVPPLEITADKWVLLYFKDSSGEAAVRSFPTKKLLESEGTLFLVNLTSLDLKGESAGDEVSLGASNQALLKFSNPKVSVTLKATETPHYSQVSLSDLDTEQSYLLLFAEPFIKGSALLNHRLIHLPNLK